MKRPDPFILGIIIFSVLILAGAIVFASTQTTKQPQTYGISDENRPQVEVDKAAADLGQMSASDIKTADFNIKNVGNRPLSISNITTSCGCTFAQMEINGEKSPRFSMHTTASWSREIAPGGQAKITAIYEPAIMPVKGKVERMVYIKTNDPAMQNLTLTVTAVVN